MTDLEQNPLRILVLDDEAITVRRLVRALQHDGYEAEGFTAVSDAMASIRQAAPAIVITDVRLQGVDGVDLMQKIFVISPSTLIILITGYASIDHAVNATKKGAFHYLAKPFKLSELRAVLAEAGRHILQTSQKERLLEELNRSDRFGEIIGSSPPMRKIFKTIRQVAAVDCNVLIQGESGTGKELVAHSLHKNSPRSKQPFVSFNCGAFSEDLVANELFGHEKGAFTGAVNTKLGLLETANGGTILLDEVTEMPMSMQVKLLRVIQERTFLRVGGVHQSALNVRFIAATNRNIEKMISAGEFRQDLFYRLKVVMIDLPPLRDRRDDIPLLVRHFAAKAAKKFGRATPEITEEFLSPLSTYAFPGNVRELEHIVERAVALCQAHVLKAADLPSDLTFAISAVPQPETTTRPLKLLEKDYIFEVYQQTGFNQSETARILGISRTTLWRRLRRFNLFSQVNQDKR
ncbi:MAG: hypothetical protein A2521_16595 [Deltaproteobacteria bacterium RIFOXYD12_FULL_57_12]|nr:MAG: hypothetical protein A2521_16595 [Deltaproteobacteria bacterium RIFOXYD12_FULL_57_12]